MFRNGRAIRARLTSLEIVAVSDGAIIHGFTRGGPSGLGLCAMNGVGLLGVRCLQTPDTETEEDNYACDEEKRDDAVNATAEHK